MSISTLICHFSAFDTWFFRESRPQSSLGNSELSSIFPPPARTLAGALRTLIGDNWFHKHGGNWRDFSANHPLQAVIGYGDDLGPLRISGPFVTLEGKRLYPAPANLMYKKEDDKTHYFLLALGTPVHCDLGFVHLPQMPGKVVGLRDLAGCKVAEKKWLTAEGIQAILDGQSPHARDVIAEDQLFASESRLGIARDNQRKGVQEGLLYQTRHLRLKDNVGIELHLHGLTAPDLLPVRSIVRLGGEGRPAALEVREATTLIDLPEARQPIVGEDAVLYTLTAMPCAANLPAGVPEGFMPIGDETVPRTWQGTLHGMDLYLLSAACPRVLREGGWDLASHRARPVQSLLAPGSALYVRRASTQAWNSSEFARVNDATGGGLCLLGRPPQIIA